MKWARAISSFLHVDLLSSKKKTVCSTRLPESESKMFQTTLISTVTQVCVNYITKGVSSYPDKLWLMSF